MEQHHLTEKILNLTLEIIYLLTGEDYGPMKKSSDCLKWSRGQITKSPPCTSKVERTYEREILQVTQKITELLTGEVPIRYQDVTVYFSMEEWEYLEGHQDLYKDVIMEDEPDGSRKGNPPQRCFLPLDSQVSSQEHQEILQDYEGLNLIVIKSEPVEKEETYIKGGESCKEEECSPEISTDDRHSGGTTEESVNITSTCKTGDVDIGLGLHSGVLGFRASTVRSTYGRQPPDDSHSSELRDGITQPVKPIPVEITEDGTRLFSCSECGKRFKQKADVVKHLRTHTGERPFSCPECGKCFSERSNAVRHWRSHTAEKTLPCPECGKCFKNKSQLLIHLRFHTDEKPYACSLCGKGFKRKSDLAKHQKLHSGKRPYSCSVCGKSFSEKSNLIRHEITHTGEKPYHCSDCGRQFAHKSQLVTHEKIHAGNRPFSCSTCGKCFTIKAVLVRHEQRHSEEKPYACSECGKSFKQRSDVAKHERIHSRVKPYSCTDCGKSFVQKVHLHSHQKFHIRDNPE